jgi:dTDP-4-dehydrorhamnose 3,5-epimerase
MIAPDAMAGVVVRPLSTFPDQRGFFREICRTADPFFAPGIAQFSHSLMYTGVIKAWHLHHLQTDWWYVGAGVVRLGLCDLRADSATHKATAEVLLGDHQASVCVRIPPGVAHGCRALQGPASLFYLQDREWDPDDVVKLPVDHPDIDFDWTVKVAHG